MRRRAVLAIALALVLPWAPFSGLSAQVEAPKKVALRVLYVGTKDSARSKDFAAFLAERFESSGTADRDAFDPKTAAGFDVVLLDWSQSDKHGLETAKMKSPLGDLAGWTKPTVLYDSAGLLIASPWKTRGSSG